MTIYLTSLTYEERSTWGECPICGAKAGVPCTPDTPANAPAEFTDTGAHVARLVNAPFSIAVAGESNAGPGI